MRTNSYDVHQVIELREGEGGEGTPDRGHALDAGRPIELRVHAFDASVARARDSSTSESGDDAGALLSASDAQFQLRVELLGGAGTKCTIENEMKDQLVEAVDARVSAVAVNGRVSSSKLEELRKKLRAAAETACMGGGAGYNSPRPTINRGSIQELRRFNLCPGLWPFC